MNHIGEIKDANSDEMRKHVFGHNYVVDRATGQPVEQGLGSEKSIANGKSDHVLQAHVVGIAREEGLEVAHATISKIQAQRRANGVPEFQFERGAIERAARAGEAARAG